MSWYNPAEDGADPYHVGHPEGHGSVGLIERMAERERYESLSPAAKELEDLRRQVEVRVMQAARDRFVEARCGVSIEDGRVVARRSYLTKTVRATIEDEAGISAAIAALDLD